MSARRPSLARRSREPIAVRRRAALAVPAGRCPERVATVKPLGALATRVADDAPDDVPTVSCSRCDRRWELRFELEELHAGNRAVEQFAMDHERHVGHFPDDVRPWVADCRRCPQAEPYLEERPARRWAQTHARHARHEVALHPPGADAEPVAVSPDAVTGDSA